MFDSVELPCDAWTIIRHEKRSTVLPFYKAALYKHNTPSPNPDKLFILYTFMKGYYKYKVVQCRYVHFNIAWEL